MRFTQQTFSNRLTLFAAAMMLLSISSAAELPAATVGPATPNISGDWSWDDHLILVAPDYAVMAFFGVTESEGPVMHVTCHTWGTMHLNQNGASFSGNSDQDGACTTQGGQSATTTPFPPSFDIDGSISGHSVHMNQDVGDGIICSYRGSLTVANGVATKLNATGGCDVPLPFHPSMNRDVIFDATRL